MTSVKAIQKLNELIIELSSAEQLRSCWVQWYTAHDYGVNLKDRCRFETRAVLEHHNYWWYNNVTRLLRKDLKIVARNLALECKNKNC